MNKLKILVVILVILIGVPVVVLGGSFTNSLISGKTPKEAIEIIAEQLDFIIGKTVVIEEKQKVLEDSLNDTDNTIEEIKKENEELKAQLESQNIKIDSQQAQRDNDIFCEDLSKIGSKFLPTKQPLKELYEALLRQNSVTFEEAYEENLASDVKVLSESDFIVQWGKDKNSRDEKEAQIKPYYDEFMAKCN